MLIYGSNSSHLKSVMLHNEACPHCGTHGSVLLSTYAKYAHIFWVPLFPTGRISISQCQHCKQTLEARQMPAQIRAYHERNLTETRVPIWQFIGLAVIALLVTSMVFSINKDKEQRAEYIKAPQKGDIYEYKAGPSSFTTFRVVDVDSANLVVNFNNYEVDKMTGIYKIDKEENYSDSTFFLSRDEVTKMFASGDIIDINRQ